MTDGIFVSIMLPAFIVKHENQINQLLKQILCISSQSYEIFEIPSKLGKEFGVKLIQNSLNLRDIEILIEENRQLHASYQKCKESLQTLNCEFEKIVNDPLNQCESDKIKYQTKKLKKVKEENKRLRQLLKSYLDNSDNRRMETHAKVELLKEELNSLVKEFAQQEQEKKQNDILISN
ncbi:unnamed protein product [Paramecium pentaurelia]|uniref:Uncharacterized protein n=1 Tax=Paramecium pentaurelia TaxID=43138 RepID=A0A8S1VGM0_9CILI|nr:unnamed protein product [Paramecium pentaurelia]